MGELNMRFQISRHMTKRLLRNTAIMMIAGFGAGCSADTMRFTDGIFTGSTNSQPVSQQQPSGGYNPSMAAAPIAAAPSSGRVQRNALPAPSAVARQPLQQPVVATANQAQNRVNDLQNSANAKVQIGVNAAETKVASAATTTHNTVVGAKEKVLGQLPTTSGQSAERPLNNAAIAPQNPAVNGSVTKSAAAGGSYTVNTGDSLYSIAQKHNVPVDQLKKANGLTNGAIRVGQSLVIPSAGATAATQVAAVTPQPANPAATAKTDVTTANVKPYTPPQASNKVIEEAESDKAEAPSSTGISQMRWPVRGKVLASYGQRDGGSISDGMDIMVPEGTAVKAAENGVVIYAGDGLKEFGNTVLIRHDNGLVTVYGHNSQNLVQRGQKVRRGEEIAKSGMSGNAKQPKLHFEVRKNSTPVNPSKYLES